MRRPGRAAGSDRSPLRLLAVLELVLVGVGRESLAIADLVFACVGAGVIVEYQRPAPSNGSAAHFQAIAKGISAAKVVDLKGTAALAIRQNSDVNRNNFGVVIFKRGGSEVRVMARNDQATLEALALSILNQSTASKSSP